MRDGFVVLVLAWSAFGCGSSNEETKGGTLGAAGSGGTGLGLGGSGGGIVLVGGGPQGGATAAGAAGSGGAAAGGGPVGGAAGVGGGSSDPYAPTFSMGKCRPNGPSLAEVPGMRLLRTAEGIDDLNGIALRGDALYYHYTREGTFRLSPPTRPVSEAVLVNEALGTTWSILATDDYLYSIHTNSRELWRTPLATLPGVHELLMEDVSESGLLWDETNLYFSASSGLGTFVLPFADALPGVMPRQLLEQRSTYQKAIWDGFLYFIDNQTISRVSLAGGTPEALFTVSSPRGLTIADGVIYLVANEVVMRRPLDATTSTSIAQGSPTYEGSQTYNELSHLVAEGDRIYFREETGSLAWVKTDGSDCRIVAKHDGAYFDNRTWVMTPTHFYLIIDDVDLVELPRTP